MKARFLFTLAAVSSSLTAAELSVTNGVQSDLLGSSGSLSGNMALFGAYSHSYTPFLQPGAAYLFRNVGPQTAPIYESAKLLPNDPSNFDSFGQSVTLSGNIGIVGLRSDTINGRSAQGSAYLYLNLDNASGTTFQNAKLTASDGAAGDQFGSSVSLSGTTAIIGARYDNNYFGSAYVFRDLHNASGDVTENAKLVASDQSYSFMGANFGYASGLSGNIAVIGAPDADIGITEYQGAAYVFRDIHTRSGTTTESAKLIASDGAATDQFGRGIAVSGNTALVGAWLNNAGGVNNRGAAYLFRGLDSRTGTTSQDAKLISSDGRSDDSLGESLSLSGNTAIAGVKSHAINGNAAQGAAYIFTNLGTATGTVIETVKVFASSGLKDDKFGSSVSIDGDLFVVGAEAGDANAVNSGKAYTGTVSSMTTLNVGNTSRLISGLSFVSQDNWIVGASTSANQVTLTAGNSATITAAGKSVAVGQQAGSNANVLSIAGAFNTTTINIGAAGNSGNVLRLANTASLSPTMLILSGGNSLSIEGDLTGAGALIAYLGDSTLDVKNGTTTTRITNGNQSTLLNRTYTNGYTTFTAVPEASAAALGLLGASSLLFRRRRL